MIGSSVGTGNLPASYELWLIVHRKGEILCLFQKNTSAHLVAKQGKGRTLAKGFQEKGRVKEVLFSRSPVQDLLGSVTVWEFSRKNVSIFWLSGFLHKSDNAL